MVSKVSAWFPGHLSLGFVGTRRAVRELGMNKHRSKWPGQKSEFGRERNQNNCAFFNLKTGCAISYQQFSTDGREDSVRQGAFLFIQLLMHCC